MDRILDRPLISIIILIILGSYLFLFRLGDLALTDPDEVFYAQTAKEMVKRGEWLTPYLYDEPQFEKPIFFYWLVELSYIIFGVNEYAARFPSAIFAILLLIITYFLGKLLFNKRVGLFAALILATNIEYIMLSRACVTDMVLGTFIILGFLFFLYGHMREKLYFYILSSVSFALATLTKGPIGILLPALIAILYFFIIKEFDIFKKPAIILWTIFAFLIVALPWYILMYKLHGNKFVDAFFGFHNIVRFLEPEHKTGSQFYYYIPVVFGGFFPWSAFLPFGIWRIFRNCIEHRTDDVVKKRHSIFILLWLLVIFIFFSLSSTKLVTYIFPAFGSLALIVALMWDDFLKPDAAGIVTKGARYSYYLLLVIIFFGAIGLYIFIAFDYPSLVTDALIAGLFLIFGFVLSLITFIKKNFIAAFFLVIYAVILFLYPLNKLVIPEIERYESSKEISEKLLSFIKDDEEIGTEKNYVSGVTFYTGHKVTNINKHHILVRFLNQTKRVWCVMKEKNHKQLYELDTKPFYTKPSYMVYKLGKKCILTNKIPDDGVYLVKRERVN